MSELDRQRTDRDARRYPSGGQPTRYSEAVNRYLGAAGYRELQQSHAHAGRSTPAPAPKVAPRQGTVVVGVDDSPASYIAVDHAAIEAELRGWDLRLLHVQRAGSARYPARDEGARLLERMTDRVHACAPVVAVSSHLAVGATATMILADTGDADLIVVGHRHGPAGTAIGFAVGERVASRHRGPAMVVRVPGWPPGPDFATRPIVVGVDASPASALAADFARNEARLRGCEVIALHAAMDEPATKDHQDFEDDVLVHHRAVAGDPIKALMTASDRAAAIVVGRRGHGGIAGIRIGSVSRALIRDAVCPVFLVG